MTQVFDAVYEHGAFRPLGALVPLLAEGQQVRVILEIEQEASAMTFEAYLRQMPDVGADGDFSRIEGSIGDVNLTE